MFTVFTSNEKGEKGFYQGRDLEEIKALVERAGHVIEKIEIENGTPDQA